MAEIGNYLEGDLAEEVRVQLENHLAHCQICHVVVDSTRRTLQIVTDTGSFDLSETVSKPITERVMARIREAKR